ncbi:MAG: hypothetical protein KGL39_20495 [Patescibacteria group bacterium]|nr:hypothetical protein [Patescibacteria group bacterium]
MTCPDHGVELVPASTQYGTRWGCPVDGCTVACWEGSTSTPATDEVRRLRQECHALFDPMWRLRKRRNWFRDRRAAYEWLAKAMGVGREDAHIGKFGKEQCERLLALLREIKRAVVGETV